MQGKPQKPLGIAVLGMEDRSRAALQMVLKGPGRGAYVIADQESAQVCIFDMDGVNAKDLWADYRSRFPNRSTLILSVDKQAIKDALFLRKPVDIDSLLRVLQLMRDQLEAAARQDTAAPAPEVPAAAPTPSGPTFRAPRREAGDLARPTAAGPAAETTAQRDYVTIDISKVDLTDPEQAKQLYFEQDEYLGGQLIKAARACMEDRLAREIACASARVVILPKTRQVVSDVVETHLKALVLLCPSAFNLGADAPLLDVQVRTLQQEAAPFTPKTAMSLDAFLWKIALRVARGRVPTGTDLTLPVVLRDWPNMTRLVLTPNALRIAALWAAKPHSLLDTAKRLDIPLSDVLVFYSAANALGLIAEAKRQVDLLLKPAPISEHRHRGVLGRILAKLLHH